jgi:hypothetical protein
MNSLPEAFGTSDRGLTGKLLVEVIGTIPNLESVDVNKINPVIAAIHAIGPRDALEGMLAVQMVSVHNVAMHRLQKATASASSGEDSNVNAATKLLRVFTNLMEALDRHRGKGDPRMVVEHLHVEKGAQAIVGQLIINRLEILPRGTVENLNDARVSRRGPLKNGNLRGDPNSAPRCGAKTRRGTPCRSPAMANGRCRMHGGMSTGPRTPEGLTHSKRARWKHGLYSASAETERQRTRQLIQDSLELLKQL